MATTEVALGFPSGAKLWKETDLGASVIAIKGSAGTLYGLELDNTQNNVASYVKMFDTAGAVTLGTTDPDWILKVPASTKTQGSVIAAIAFSAGLKIACVTTAGTAGTTAPTNDVVVQVVYS